MFEFLKSYLPDSKYPVNKTGEDDQIEELLPCLTGCVVFRLIYSETEDPPKNGPEIKGHPSINNA